MLTDQGLDVAIRALAERAPVPIELIRIPDERLQRSVEAAIYYLVAEAITNVAKYARATKATSGLADRVEALGGRLRIDSPAGRGTQLTAEIPCS